MAACGSASDEYGAANVHRWMVLFNFTYEQAERALHSHLRNFSRATFTDEQWSIISEKPDARGHDKESYSYYLTLAKSKKPASKATDTPQEKTCKKPQKYLFKLEAPLDTAEKIRDAFHLAEIPPTTVDITGEHTFAIVLASVRTVIEELLHPAELTFASLKEPAEKELSAVSIAPTLGVDATMPQHRFDAASQELSRDEYPVPYFFYGTLAEPAKLTSLLALTESPTFVPTKIMRGKLKSWGKYRALVDGSERDEVQGWMYLVACKEHEDALRSYEGDTYEVVRCELVVERPDRKELVKGLTFRFCEDEAVPSA
ncbi:hypothetical protein CC80DRAFT_499351 [Byssothecium circinans]|uniref:Putative gamma-glutamylcyclotransferase n=1 Tax=Byssothecium circinans TaxID=147558 RepID=A0A6A5UGI3_9PLEO|nr:hypothetical protein CC80DRAFT_499351 [Byssothecium circinans]